MTIERKGFSLLELLIVVAIIGVLLALLLPAVQKAREAANRQLCAGNMRQQALALNVYHDAYNYFPPAMINSGSVNADNADSNFYFPRPYQAYNHTGFLLLLPFLEQNDLYKTYNFDYPAANLGGPLAGGGIENCPGNANANIVGTVIPTYTCPSDDPPTVDNFTPVTVTGTVKFGPITQTVTLTTTAGACTNARRSNYLLCAGGSADTPQLLGTTGGVFGRNRSAKRKDIKDGLSQTIVIGESRQKTAWNEMFFFRMNFSRHFPHWGAGPVTGGALRGINVPAGKVTDEWSASHPQYPSIFTPSDPDYRLPIGGSFSSRHGGGANIAFADGTVHFVKETISLSALNSLTTVQGRYFDVPVVLD